MQVFLLIEDLGMPEYWGGPKVLGAFTTEAAARAALPDKIRNERDYHYDVVPFELDVLAVQPEKNP